ncbi:MAG: hypothetical protein AMXMBFR13_35890 [Phycisphaerae bacterium]
MPDRNNQSDRDRMIGGGREDQENDFDRMEPQDDVEIEVQPVSDEEFIEDVEQEEGRSGH